MNISENKKNSRNHTHSVIILFILLFSAFGVIFTEQLSPIERKLTAALSMFVNYKLKNNEYLCIAPNKDDANEYRSLCEGAKLASFLSAGDTGLQIELTTIKYNFNDSEIVKYIEESNVAGIIGLDIHSFNSELRTYVKRNNIPVISPLEYGFSSDNPTYEFQSYLGLDMYSSIRSILTFSKNILLTDNIILVAKKDHYASVQRNILHDSLTDFGIEHIGDIEVPSDVTDQDIINIISTIVNKTKKQGNSLIYVSTSLDFALKLENKLREIGIDSPIVLSVKQSIDEVVKHAKSDANHIHSISNATSADILNLASSASNIYVAEPFDYDAAGQASDTFRNRYMEVFGHLPTRSAAYGFDALNYFNKMIKLELEQINQSNKKDNLLPILQSSLTHNTNNRYSHTGVTGRIYMSEGVNRNDSFLMKRFERGRLEIPYIQTSYIRSDPYSWNYNNWRSGAEYYQWIDKYSKNVCVARHVLNDIRISQDDETLFEYEIDYYLSSKYPIRMSDLSVHDTRHPYAIAMTDFLYDSNGVYHVKFNIKGAAERSRMKVNKLTGHSQFNVKIYNRNEKIHNWIFIVGDEFNGDAVNETSSNGLYIDDRNIFSHTVSKIETINKYPNYNRLGMRSSDVYNSYVVSVDFKNTQLHPYLYLAKRLSDTHIQTAVFVSVLMLILLLWFPRHRNHRLYPLAFTLTAYLFLSVLAYHSMKADDQKITILVRIVISAMPVYLLLTYGLRCVKIVYQRFLGREMSSVYNLIIGFLIILINFIFATNFLFSVSFAALLAYSSVITIVLGIALRNLIMDAFSGILLSVENAISTTDWIAINNRIIGEAAEGRVKKMCWRSVLIETRSKDLVNVPNSIVISSSLKNYCKPTTTTRIKIPIEIDNTHSVESILKIFSSLDDQKIIENELQNPKIIVRGFEKSAVLYHAFIHFDIVKFGPDDARTRFLGILTKLFESNSIQYSVNRLKIIEDSVV